MILILVLLAGIPLLLHAVGSGQRTQPAPEPVPVLPAQQVRARRRPPARPPQRGGPRRFRASPPPGSRVRGAHTDLRH